MSRHTNQTARRPPSRPSAPTQDRALVALSPDLDNPLRGISLCAGVGGLELGLQLAEPRYQAVCYVERDAHAAAVLVARMAEAALCDAPVWDDVATFDGRPWRGVVDILSAGYPCQPFSAAGKRMGERDPRHLWPHVARIVRQTGARRVFLENVEGHVTLGFAEVAGELQGMGYRVKAGLFSALECGAPHWRRRLFVMADADGRALGEQGGHAGGRRRSADDAGDGADRPAGRHAPGHAELVGPMAVRGRHGLEAGPSAFDLPLFPPAPCDYQD